MNTRFGNEKLVYAFNLYPLNLIEKLATKNKNPYKAFDQYVLRTPLLSIDYYKKLTAADAVSEADLREICQDKLIREAIFLASPSLLFEIDKWLAHELTDPKKCNRLKDAVLKYVARICARCTPFGLFAGCTVGQFSDEDSSQIEVKNSADHTRHSRLDMNLLVALAQKIAKIPEVRAQVSFFPNSSIYNIADKLRYIDYQYVHGQRHHEIVEVDNSEYLQNILSAARQGAVFEELVAAIDEPEISYEDKSAFIDELIDSNLLISDLEPSLSGPEFFDQLTEVLGKLDQIEDLKAVFAEIRHSLTQLDHQLGNDAERYLQLKTLLDKLEVTVELKFMIQADLVTQTNHNTLSNTLTSSLLKGLTVMNKISAVVFAKDLPRFINDFYERYGEREVPLSKALDVEIGLGYPRDRDDGDVNPLVDNLVLVPEEPKIAQNDIQWNAIHAFFYDRLQTALHKGEQVVRFQASDFKNLDENWDDLPDTMSVITELVLVDGQPKLKFAGIGGPSAANLLSRFAYGDEKLHHLVKEIVQKETHMNQHKILAEIVHLPESRTGNILMRPAFRQYEIPFLAKSNLDHEHQLPLEDLYLSIKGQKQLVLKSKRLGKEVVPNLTNAHNYPQDALPVYHFLCDMQIQGKRLGVRLNWGPLANEFRFLPRIEYENLILHEATWNIRKADIEGMVKAMKDDKLLKQAMKLFMKAHKIPPYVLLKDGDNKLLINFDNLSLVRILLQIVKDRNHFTLTEFLFGEECLVKNEKGESYTNQVIISLYNEAKLHNNS